MATPNAGARPGSMFTAGFLSTITVAAPPSSISSSADQLRNDSGYPVLLDSIRFEASYTNSSGFVVPASLIPFHVRVFKGRDNLTNEYVPVASVCKPHVRLATTLSPVGLQAYAQNETGAFVWRFEKPVYLAPQEVLSVDFAYATPVGIPPGTFTDALAPYTVSITGVGRVMPWSVKPSDHPWLPFASAFTSGFQQLSQTPTNTVIASTAAQLYNPKSNNLFVKDVFGYGEVYDSGASVPARVDVNDTNLLDLSISGTQVQLVNASAIGAAMGESFNIGIRDPVPFYHAFLPQDRTWHLNAVLSPSSYLTATLSLTQWQAVRTSVSARTTAYAQYVIGMTGYFKRSDL